MPNVYKIVTVGDPGVGKSSVVLRLSRNIFDKNSKSTIAAAFTKILIRDGNEEKDTSKNVTLMIWDTAGQEKYHCLMPLYLRSIKAVIFVFDLTQPETLQKMLDYWIPNVDEHTNCEYVKIILGNKKDLVKDQIMDEYEDKILTLYPGSIFKLVSARTGEGVKDSIMEFIEKIKPDRFSKTEVLQYMENVDKQYIDLNIKLDEEEEKKTCCYH